jgi:hypothetical protein
MSEIYEHVDARRAAILRSAARELFKLAKTAADEGADQGRVDNTHQLGVELRDKACMWKQESTREMRELGRLMASVPTTRNIELRDSIISKLREERVIRQEGAEA